MCIRDRRVIVEHDGELIRKSDPVYMEPQGGGLLSAHFYAPAKLFFGAPISTLAANVLVIWIMTLMLCGALHMELFKKIGRLLPVTVRKLR